MTKNYQEEYFKIVEPILKNSEFLKRKNYPHHGEISVYDHTLKVSMLAFGLAKKLGINSYNVAVAGLLHDFYDKPWQDDHTKHKFLESHGFVHARQAEKNARTYFEDMVNYRILNSIRCHMFPLNITPPRYIEGWVITLVDKYVSMEIFLHPFSLYRYIGIRKRK